MGLGKTADGFSSDVEAIGFHDMEKYCRLPNFPYAAESAIGSNSKTGFCGGRNDTHHTNECYALNKENVWTLTVS